MSRLHARCAVLRGAGALEDSGFVLAEVDPCDAGGGADWIAGVEAKKVLLRLGDERL